MADERVRAQAVDLLNASLLADPKDQVDKLRSLSELLLRRCPALLPEFVTPLMELQGSPHAVTRKWLAGFLESLLSGAPAFLPGHLPRLVALVDDATPAVAKRALLAGAVAYRSAIAAAATGNLESATAAGAAWPALESLRCRAVAIAGAGIASGAGTGGADAGRQLTATKVMETILLALSDDDPGSGPAAAAGRRMGLPPGTLDRAAEATATALAALIAPATLAALPGPVAVVALAAAGVVGGRRPSLMPGLAGALLAAAGGGTLPTGDGGGAQAASVGHAGRSALLALFKAKAETLGPWREGLMTALRGMGAGDAAEAAARAADKAAARERRPREEDTPAAKRVAEGVVGKDTRHADARHAAQPWPFEGGSTHAQVASAVASLAIRGDGVTLSALVAQLPTPLLADLVLASLDLVLPRCLPPPPGLGEPPPHAPAFLAVGSVIRRLFTPAASEPPWSEGARPMTPPPPGIAPPPLALPTPAAAAPDLGAPPLLTAVDGDGLWRRAFSRVLVACLPPDHPQAHPPSTPTPPHPTPSGAPGLLIRLADSPPPGSALRSWAEGEVIEALLAAWEGGGKGLATTWLFLRAAEAAGGKGVPEVKHEVKHEATTHESVTHEATPEVTPEMTPEMTHEENLDPTPDGAWAEHDRLLLSLCRGLTARRPPRERSLPRLLLASPRIPPPAINLLASLCLPERSPPHATPGDAAEAAEAATGALGALRDIILQRPPARKPALALALACAAHTHEPLRTPAVKLAANLLLPHAAVGPAVVEFALAAVDDAVAECVAAADGEGESGKAEGAKAAEGVKTEAVKAEGAKAEAAKAEPAKAEPAKAGPGKAGPPKPEPPPPSPALARLGAAVALLSALTSRRPSLLPRLVAASGRAPPAAQAVFESWAPQLARALGAVSESLAAVARETPPGGGGLVLAMISAIADGLPPPAALPAPLASAARALWEAHARHARYLVPLLGTLTKAEALASLPALTGLPPQSLRHALSRLAHPVAPGVPGGPLTPAELLVAIHGLESGTHGGPALPLKRAIDACTAALSLRGHYDAAALASALGVLAAQSPPPTLLMRTALQALAHSPSLGGYVAGDLLPKLAARGVWKHPQLWEGFLLAAAKTAPASHAVLLALPTPQLESALAKRPELKAALAAAAGRGAGGRAAAGVTRGNLVLLGLAKPAEGPS